MDSGGRRSKRENGLLFIDIIGRERERELERKKEREHRPQLAVSCAVTMWAGTDCEVQCGRIDSANTPTIAVDTAC